MALRFGDFVFDAERRQVARGDEEIHLPPRTLRFLEALLEEYPRAVDKRELMKRIWPDAVVEESNLKTIASELRAALNDHSRELIRTVQRYGYAFGGEVSADEPLSRTYLLYGDDIRVSLSRAEAIIGRHPGCDVWIDSADVSRQHARISIRPEGILVEDLGSKNGTWIGGKQISEPTELHDGDRLRVGDVTLRFRAPTGNESTRSHKASD
jgi:DNA-binding winged helix-turn-helix (wHTH) protein